MKDHATLNLTVKTHKRAPEFRNIHAASNWRLSGLSIAVTSVLDRKLNELDHLIKSTKDFTKAISKIKPEAAHKFAKFDIKHFYMSGEPHVLASLCSKAFNDLAWRDAVYDAVFLLLDAQTLNTPYGVHKVIRGSGMGLCHSGAVAELAFYVGGEQKLISQLGALEIALFKRFKDDIIMLFKTFHGLKNATNIIKDGKHPFRIECEDIGRSVKFLQVRVEVGLKEFLVYPEAKPTALLVPRLSMYSAHAPSVLDAWPSCQLKNELQLCSSLALKRDHFHSFLSDMMVHHHTHNAIAKALLLNPVAKPKHTVCNFGGKAYYARPRSTVKGRRQNVGAVWLILPFFSGFRNTCLSKAIGNLFKSSFISRELALAFCERPPKLSMSWSNPGKHLARIIKSPAEEHGDGRWA